MQNTVSNIPMPGNEPIFSYAPGTPERALLDQELQEISARQLEIPIVIGGRRITTGKTGTCIEPHIHASVLATYQGK